MESKKINQLATEMSPAISDLTIIGDPITGVSKKITLLQIADLFQTTGTVTSVAVTETGDALSITGSPITTAGTINIGFAGSANQYVRGDGALAPFPTTTGGGSSVSYYLNGSVNQGTFGGSTYYQMSKDAVIGVGTNFSTSSNGLIAQFITDANDPDVVQIPSGNWNIEFFMNVSASSGALASFYVEIYKYNGSTFTLLATNSATPEELTNTTTVDAYYTSVAMPTSALSVTDRLAIRIYANVASKTVTLYTEDNRLCQVVTTLSKGMVSLNNLTDQSQYLTTGTSGTNFNIVSSGDTHTFNLPVASATNTGKLSNTDWSTFNNKQAALSFTAPLVNTSNTISIPAATSSVDGYLDNLDWVNFNTAYNNMIVSAAVTGTTTKTLTLTQQDAGTITASWTDDNTDAVTSVFGRTGAVVAASGDYTTTQVTEGTNLYYTDARSRGALSFTAGSGAYNSTTGVITIPTNNNQITNGAGYITSSALSAYLPLIGGTLTGALSGTSATFSSTTTATAFIPTGSTIPTNGMYLSAANTLNFATNSANRFTIASDGVATFGTDLYVNRNIYVTDIEAGVGANYFSPYSGGSTPLSFNYNSAGSVVWNNGGTKMTLTSAGALQLVSSISATSATLNGNVIINSTATALSPLQVVATGTIVRLGEQSGTTGKQFLIGIDATSGRSELQSVWQGTAFTSLALQPSGGNVLIGTTGDNGAKLQVSGAATFSSSVTSDDLILTAGTLFGTGVTGFSNRASDTTLYLQMPATGFNITDNALNTKFIFSSTGAATFSSSVTAASGLYNGYTSGLPPTSGSATRGGLRLNNASNIALDFGTVAAGQAWLQVSDANNYASNFSLLLNPNGGSVGIGTNSPSSLNAGANQLVVGNGSSTQGLTIYTGSASDGNIYFANGTTGSQVYNGAIVYNHSSNYMIFATNGGTERMRITSGGNVLIGKSTTGVDTNGFRFDSNGVLFTSVPTGESTYYLRDTTNAVYRFYVTSGGTINATNTTISAISDVRLKENITDLQIGLDAIMALRPRQFDWKKESGNSGKNVRGFIAQEFEEVFPDLIDESINKTPEGEPYKQIRQDLIPILVKAIQELNERIKQLENK